ncbi:MAG: hypothetical protein E6713_06015 [Sporomusaceae bacterium]|nr:hypothetical protein [Sporomusaceae bacterium]
MSKVQAIELRNFKGQSLSQPLTGKDLFIGRNGSGKTSRIQALGLSMLGYVPKNGKTASETFKLATGDEIFVGLKTDTFSFGRSFERKEKTNRTTGDKSVSVTESITLSPGRGEKNDTSKKSRIADEIGDFPVMLDVNEFLGLSDAKRRDFIYSLSPIKSPVWNKDRVSQYLEKMLTVELKTNNFEHYQAMNEMIGKAMDQYPEGYSVQDGLQSMLDWAETERKYWESKNKDAKGAVRQFSDLKNQMAETERNLKAAREEMDQLQKDLIDREKQISTDIEKKKAIDAKIKRISELEELLRVERLKPITDLVAMDREISELQAKVQEVPDVEAEASEILKEVNVTRSQMDQVKLENSKIITEIQSLENTLKSITAAIEQTKGIDGICVIHHMIRCPKDFSGVGDQVKAWKESQVDPKLNTLKGALEASQRQLKTIQENEKILTEKHAALLKKAQAAISHNNTINKSVTAIQKKKQDGMAESAERKSRMQSYQEEIDRLQKQPHEFIAPIDVLQVQTVGMKTRIEELKKDISEKEKAKQAVALVQQSMIDNRMAEYNAIAIKSILEKLGPKGVQGEIVKEVLEPIRESIAANLKICGFDYEPFFQTQSDTGKEIFQFGWQNEKGHQVNFDALSTGQQTIFLAAMMVTIIERAQPKTRILVMDDLNHLDRQNFQLFINGVDRLSDKLDNIILAGAIEFDFSCEGWQVWNLSESVSTQISA